MKRDDILFYIIFRPVLQNKLRMCTMNAGPVSPAPPISAEDIRFFQATGKFDRYTFLK